MLLPCRTFAANAVRLQLHALAYNLGNFLRTLATPEAIKDWSLTSLKEKLIKIGAKVVTSGRYVAFQMAEVAIPKNLFADILRLIAIAGDLVFSHGTSFGHATCSSHITSFSHVWTLQLSRCRCGRDMARNAAHEKVDLSMDEELVD